jgi:hypothetical protein
LRIPDLVINTIMMKDDDEVWQLLAAGLVAPDFVVAIPRFPEDLEALAKLSKGTVPPL